MRGGLERGDLRLIGAPRGLRTTDDVAKASEKGGWSCLESMELRVAGRDAGRALY